MEVREAVHELYKLMPDKMYLQFIYHRRFNKYIDFKNPKTFNEKINWLKIYDRRPEYHDLVDKYEVKRLVAEKIGSEHVIPLYGLWDNYDEIDISKLPDTFVLKCTHDSGSVFICRDKKNFDAQEARAFLEYGLKRDFYWPGREWVYKGLKPRIIAEALLIGENGEAPKDYKVFCFNGVPKLVQVDIDRFGDHKRNLYTTDWEFVDASMHYPVEVDTKIERPAQLEDMLEFARILSANIPQVRVDFYLVQDKIYFGELTFYHACGWGDISPESLNEEMGEWIHLPAKTN